MHFPLCCTPASHAPPRTTSLLHHAAITHHSWHSCIVHGLVHVASPCMDASMHASGPCTNTCHAPATDGCCSAPVCGCTAAIRCRTAAVCCCSTAIRCCPTAICHTTPGAATDSCRSATLNVRGSRYPNIHCGPASNDIRGSWQWLRFQVGQGLVIAAAAIAGWQRYSSVLTQRLR